MTDSDLPRYWREQIYQQLSAMSSEYIKPGLAGLHGQASTCVSRRDRVRLLERSAKLQESTSNVCRDAKKIDSKVSNAKLFDSKVLKCKTIQFEAGKLQT